MLLLLTQTTQNHKNVIVLHTQCPNLVAADKERHPLIAEGVIFRSLMKYITTFCFQMPEELRKATTENRIWGRSLRARSLETASLLSQKAVVQLVR